MLLHIFVGRRRLAAVVVTIALLIGLALAPAGVAFAEAGANASCMGHEASAISPPGSSSEVPGGMPALKEILRTHFGLSMGEFARIAAKLHEGSHEACDAAFGG